MEKIDYKHGRFLILTTEWDEDDFPYEEYVMDCEINGIKPKSSSSDDYYDWIRDIVNENYESDLENIKYCKQYNVPVVIEGSVGRWDGSHTIVPVEANSVYDAILKCVDGVDDVEVHYDDGKIEVVGKHHDANNVFTISAIGSRGRKKRLPYLYAI